MQRGDAHHPAHRSCDDIMMLLAIGGILRFLTLNVHYEIVSPGMCGLRWVGRLGSSERAQPSGCDKAPARPARAV
jgi:hypothetical protein